MVVVGGLFAVGAGNGGVFFDKWFSENTSFQISNAWISIYIIFDRITSRFD